MHAIPPATEDLAARIAAVTAKSLTRLTNTQHADGGWGQLPDDPSDVLSTASAIPVLARHGDPLSAGRAVTPRASTPCPPLQSARIPAIPARRTPSGTAPTSWSALQAGLRGVLLASEQAAYEQARLLVSQRFDDIRPQAIAYPADALSSARQTSPRTPYVHTGRDLHTQVPGGGQDLMLGDETATRRLRCPAETRSRDAVGQTERQCQWPVLGSGRTQ